MLKKMSKSICFFLLVLFMAGSFCLFPKLKVGFSDALNYEQYISEHTQGETYNAIFEEIYNNDYNEYVYEGESFVEHYYQYKDINAQNNSALFGSEYFNQERFGHKNVMVITTAEQLAEVAFWISWGNDICQIMAPIVREDFNSQEEYESALEEQEMQLKLLGIEGKLPPITFISDNEGNQDVFMENPFRMGIYSLEADLDLSGSLWTPIGNSNSEFAGVFYGNGHTISNITIDDVTSSEGNSNVNLGLFGKISEATICDLVIGGSNTIVSSSTNANCGTLVGSTNRSYIINCFDKSTSKTGTNNKELSPIGKIESSGDNESYFYAGNSFDGKTPICKNITEYFQTVITDSFDTYVGVYNAGEGEFKIGNEKWYDRSPDSDSKTLRTLFKVVYYRGENNTNLTKVVPINEKPYMLRSNIHYASAPKLRIETTNENEVYVIKPGFKASFRTEYKSQELFMFAFKPGTDLDDNSDENLENNVLYDQDLIDQGEAPYNAYLVSPMGIDISYEEATINTTFDYGYSSSRSYETLTFPYDTPFCEIFEEHPGLLQRAGYELDEFYKIINPDNTKTAVNIETADDYKDSYINDNERYFLTWNYNDKIQRNFGIKFAYSSEEGGKMAENFSSVDKMKGFVAHDENGVAKIEGIKEASAGMLEEGIIYENSANFAEGSDNYTFKITLAQGYKLVSASGYDPSMHTYTKTPEIVNNKANVRLGAYPSFTNMTGKGYDYDGSETKNNDSYNSVLIEAGRVRDKDNEDDQIIPLPGGERTYNERAAFAKEKEYIVNVNNVVGPGGHVILVIERDWTYVDVTPHMVDDTVDISYFIEDGIYLNKNGDAVDKNNNLFYDNQGNILVDYPSAVIYYGKGKPFDKNNEIFIDENGIATYPDAIFNGIENEEGVFERPVIKEDGSNCYILQMRKGDSINLTISVGTAVGTVDRYLLNVETDNFMKANDGENESGFTTYKISYPNQGVWGAENPEEDFFNVWDVNLNNTKEYSNTFRPYIGDIKTKVAINLYKNDFDEQDNMVNVQPLDDMTGIGVTINGATKYQNVTGELVGMAIKGEIASTRSGKYEAHKVVISEYKGQSSSQEVDLGGASARAEYPKTITLYNPEKPEKGEYPDEYYWTRGSSVDMMFRKAFTHDSDDPIYQVDVYYKQRKYDINIEYYAGSNLTAVKPSEGEVAVIPEASVDQIKPEFADRYFSNASFGFASQSPSILIPGGGTYNFGFKLNSTGKGVLSYAGYELYQDGKVKVRYQNSANPEQWEKEGFTNSSLVEPENPGISDENFELTLGGYDTKIKIFFEYRSVNLLIDKVHVLNEEGYLGLEDKALLQYTIEGLTFKIGANGELSLTNGSDQLDSISIHSQFYLLGWYLQNGKMVNVDSEGNFNGLLTNSDFVGEIAELGADKENGYVNNSIAALVGRRTVSASYNAGAAGFGKLYENGTLDDADRRFTEVNDNALHMVKAGQNIVYNQIIGLSRFAFYNLGYKFNGYRPNGVTIDGGTFVSFGNVVIDENGNITYTISGSGWDQLFKLAKENGAIINDINSDGFQNWNMLAENDLHRRAEVELIANWQLISYSAIIDGSTIVSDSSTGKTGLSIGDTIYYTTTPAPNHKNGLATYVINGTTLSGQTIFGYYAKGYKIWQNSEEICFESLGDGEANKITITPEIFELFIKEEYKFKENTGDDNIFINTIREEADYYVFLENSENNYYRYDWNENLDTNDYGQIIDGRIAINVKYNNPATNIIKAIEDKVLVVNRYGYTEDKNLWSIAGNAGQSVTMFKPQDKYLTTGDSFIVPTWIKDEQGATKSEINFTEEARDIRNFYLLNDFNIISAAASGNHVEDGIDISRKPILNNGEQIVGFKFILSANGGEEMVFENIKEFNINNLNLSGAYTIKFVIDVKDTLTKYNEEGAYSIEYASPSRILSFNMVKNELHFFENDFASVYNGSNAWTPSAANNYGKFMLKFNWKGDNKANSGNLSEYSIGVLDDYFTDFAIEGDYNASASSRDKKNLKFKFNPERPILGNEELNYFELISNVIEEEGQYYILLENVLTIEKAKFTIHFPNGSAYRFDNINAVVYENVDKLNFTGDFANGKTFGYTFDKIMLLVNDAAVYTGKEDYNQDKDIFTIYGLKFANDFESNFEWNIANYNNHGDSRFILKEIGSAKGYTYNLAYLLSSQGKLNDTLASQYLGESGRIELSNLIIDGKPYQLPNTNQGSIQVGNDIIFSYAGNGTNNLKLFVNDEVMAIYPFSVRLNIILSDEAMNGLKLLTWTNNPNVSMLDAMFETWQESGWSTTISPSVTDGQNNELTAVLTDVVKVFVNYNTGTNGDNELNEIIYVSVADNILKVSNPIHEEGRYLTFNGYNKPSNSRLDITFDPLWTSFSVKNSCSVEYITAKWKFDEFDFNSYSEIALYANAGEIEQNLSSFVTVDAPNGSSITASMTSVDGKTSFAYNANNASFVIKDENGLAGANLTGKYQISVTLTYNDGFGDQRLTKTCDIKLILNKKMINFYIVNQNLTYNNSVQNVSILLEMDDESKEVNLQSLPKIDNSMDNQYHFYINILDKNNQISVLRNAGTYTIRATVDSKLQNVYQFINDEITIDKELTIKQYTISLKNYNDQIEFIKYVGTNDPVLSYDIEIEHDSESEIVEILFERESGGAVGSYLLINPKFIEDADKNNYKLNLAGFEAYLVIETPNANLQIEFKERPSYVYNSLAVNRQVVTVENNKFILSLYNDDTLLDQVEFDLYYLSVNGEEVEKVYISDDAKQDHIRLINFSFENISANAGDYPLSVTLNEVEDFDYTGIEFVDKSISRLKVEKKRLEVLSIAKNFNRNDAIGKNDVTFEGVVDGDEVYISGRYTQVTVGQNIKLSGVTLAGSAALNYSIADVTYYGEIIAVDGGSVIFSINETEFVYGQFNNNLTINEAFALTKGYILSIGGITEDVKNGYVQASAVVISEGDLSSGGYLKAGRKTIKFVFTSENFTNLQREGYEVSINVSALELDLSSLEIIKNYDETTLLPEDLNTNIDQFILNGDLVAIDLAKGGYQTAEVGEDKKVVIVLGGADAANYTVKDNVTGTIKAFTINVVVNASTEHIDLVTRGRFVEDGLLPSGDNATFIVGYPNNQSGEDILKTFKAPTRKGYSFSGWKIKQGEGYIAFDKDNIESVLRELSLSSEEDNVNLTIYAVWEIEKYEIDITGEQIQNIAITANPVYALSETDGKQYVEYFSDLQIEITGNRGYKIRSYNLAIGQSEDKNLSDTNKNKGTITFDKIASRIELVVTFEDIIINFNIDFNMPKFTNRVDNNSLNQAFGYFALANITRDDLPVLAVSEGTYKFLGYSYQENLLDENPLKDLIDQIFIDLNEDQSVILMAMWQGENYLITFDPTQGVIADAASKTITGVYGQAIYPFPNAYLEGREPAWTDKNGKIYNESDLLATIGEKGENNVYSITLTADWISQSYDIAITFDEGLTVKVGGQEIVSGANFTLVYGQDNLTLEITAKKGYGFIYNSKSIKAKIEEINGRIVISNLYEDGTLHFTLEPNVNTLTLFNSNVDSFEVYVDEVKVESQTTISARTGQNVEVIYKAKKGYNFDSTSYNFRGEGSFTTELSQDGKTLSVKWEDFTGNAVITVDGVASILKVTIGDVRDIFMRLTFGTTNINLSGDTFMVRTGERFVIYGVMAYGYTAGLPSTGIVNYVEEGSVNNYYSEEDKYYHFTAALSGFDEDFAISFLAKARSFNFKVSVMPGLEEYGEITCQSEQKVDFGSAIVLSQRELVSNFEFTGWMIDEKVISTEGEINYIVTSAIKDALERAGEDGVIEIFAVYARKARDIALTARTSNNPETNKNGFIASQIDENIVVEVNGTTSAKFYLGLNLDIKLNMAVGYELDYVLIDGSRINLNEEQYHFDGTNFVIALDLDSTISSLEIVFKAGKIEVIVQAGTIINYVDHLGTDAGGSVWAVDKNGDRLGDDVYKEYQGNLLIGANYKLISHTDEVLYFEVEAKNGFTPSIMASVGLIVNELNINGRKIYAISGATEDSKITVLFTARENKLKIIFANEGEDIKPVHGGVIVVDTSSALVSSNPSRGDNINVSVVTGGSLNFTVSSMISYSLVVDENGYIKYDVIGGEDNGNIVASKVESQDPVQTGTGFTGIANMTINDVISDGTIVIYVKPKEYSIKFVVDAERDISVTMSEKVRYGEEWSLDSLSASEKGKIFASKKDFTFTGYYTAENSYGIQYIDRYGEVVLSWQHSGYSYDGSKYKADGNFDPETDTFTLYAGWIFNRASVRVEVIPVSAIENKNFNIRSFATNINSFDPWIDQNDLWYAEIGVGSVLNFAAPKIDGYVFAGFTLQFEGGEEIAQDKTFNLTLEMGDYIVRARYNPIVKITVKNNNNNMADGGNSFARQDGGIISESYDINKLLSLVSTPTKGYNFLYWIDEKTEEIYYGKPNSNGEIVFDFESLIDRPLYLTAVFEGKSIAVTFDYSILANTHKLLDVKVNGKVVDYNNPFTALVGDTIVVRVKKARGYGFDNSLFDRVYDEINDCYVFTYTISVDDLTEIDSTKYSLYLAIPITKEDISITFNIKVSQPIDNKEHLKGGYLEYSVDANKSLKIESGKPVVFKYGDIYNIRINPNANYAFLKAYLKVDGALYDVSKYVSNNLLQINKELIDRYFNYSLTFDIHFVRLLWTDEEARASEFAGLGTAKEPYRLASAKDFALMAYLVNNGLENEEGVKYSKCFYKVTNDIDFYGRFWEPIGTEENPFDGTIDIGKHTFKNVSHYKSYPSPKLSYTGLFWHIGKDARFNVDKQSFTIIIIVVCVLVFVIILIVLLIILLTIRRKKKLEKLANQ